MSLPITKVIIEVWDMHNKLLVTIDVQIIRAKDKIFLLYLETGNFEVDSSFLIG